jgi:hypothetical protein
MQQLANSIAAACIDAGASILAVPNEFDSWGQEFEFRGHKFRLNQHFYVSYLLREHDADEYLNYVQPGQLAMIRSVRQIIKGNLVSALIQPKDLAGDLGFLVDNYQAQYARELTFVGLREHNLFEKMIAIDDVPYMVMHCHQGDGYLNVLLDRPLDQPASPTSALTGGRFDAHKANTLVKDGGLLVVSPRFTDSQIPGTRNDYSAHGINVREHRAYDAAKKSTQVTFDVMLGVKVYPENCQLL